MTDVPGDIITPEGQVIRVVYSKTNTAIVKGQCVIFDTDGYAPCAATTVAGTKGGIALDDVAAVVATRQLFRVLMHGSGRILKTTGANALYAGETPTFDNSGAMKSGGNAVENMTVIKDAVDADDFYEVFIS